MTQQRALVLRTRLGRFSVASSPIPNPGPNEVLLKIHAGSLNPVDVAIQKMGIFVDHYPAIVGCDLAGEVMKLGKGVQGIEIGDRIMLQGAFSNTHAGFQEYALADVNTLAKIPENVSYDQAATMPLVCVTAYLAMYNAIPHGLGMQNPLGNPGAYRDTPFFVVGGASSVGQYAIQFAKASGFNPIIATASPKHAERLLSLGATHVLDRNLSVDTLRAALLPILTAQDPAQSLTYIVDAIGGKDTQHLAMSCLEPGGRMTTVREPVFKDGFKGKGISQVVALKTLPQNLEIMKELWANMNKLLISGTIGPLPFEVIPDGLAGIPGGLQRLEEQKVSGAKLIYHPQETGPEYS